MLKFIILNANPGYTVKYFGVENILISLGYVLFKI
jgi:hypothetical protein